MLAAETGPIAFPILTALILVPAIGSLLVAVLPKSRPELPKVVALMASVGTLAMSIWLVFMVRPWPMTPTIVAPINAVTGRFWRMF